MQSRRMTFWVLVLAIVLAGAVHASSEDKFGVPVYPGAIFDSDVTNILKRASREAAGYRTHDSITKVVGFYKRQAGMALLDSNAEAALFIKGNVTVTIQNPWLDRRSMRIVKGTLISIRRHTN